MMFGPISISGIYQKKTMYNVKVFNGLFFSRWICLHQSLGIFAVENRQDIVYEHDYGLWEQTHDTPVFL